MWLNISTHYRSPAMLNTPYLLVASRLVQLLAPKKSKLKSAIFDRPRVDVPQYDDEESEEGVTPVVNNKSAKKQSGPPSVSISSDVLAVAHSPKSGAISPRLALSSRVAFLLPSPIFFSNAVNITFTPIAGASQARSTPSSSRLTTTARVPSENIVPLRSSSAPRPPG